MKKRTIALLLALALTAAVPYAWGEEKSSLYVKKVEILPEDFIFGMDVSSVIAQEQSGVKYYDFDGNGEFTDQDAIYLLFYYFYPDKYPLK